MTLNALPCSLFPAPIELMIGTPQETAREAVPFYIAMLTVILIIAFIPQVTMFLPNLVYR